LLYVRYLSEDDMSAFVCCHGAWGGGWGWTRVAALLRAAGHEVFTPTYTGQGERSHLLSPDVDLATHVLDVRNLIKYERLDEFVLVGHSYGGMVVTGVADAEWRKISRLVYLDAFLPRAGQSLNDLTPPDRAKAVLEVARIRGDGYKVPRPEGSISPTLPDEDRAWIESLSGPQPLKTMTQPVAGDNNHLKIEDKIYVLCTQNNNTPFYKFAEWTRSQPDWKTIELPTHHHLLQSMPRETADILMGKQP
jgi:pimeloyl-ACP methyl ester carboxylesterase